MTESNEHITNVQGFIFRSARLFVNRAQLMWSRSQPQNASTVRCAALCMYEHDIECIYDSPKHWSTLLHTIMPVQFLFTHRKRDNPQQHSCWNEFYCLVSYCSIRAKFELFHRLKIECDYNVHDAAEQSDYFCSRIALRWRIWCTVLNLIWSDNVNYFSCFHSRTSESSSEWK